MIADKYIEAVVEDVRKHNLRIPLDQVFVLTKAGDRTPLDMPCEIKQDQTGLHLILRTTHTTAIPEPIQNVFGVNRNNPVSVTPNDYFEVEGRTPQGLPVRLGGVSPLTSRQQQTFWANAPSAQSHSLSFQQIHFPATGLDTLDTDGVLDELHKAKVEASKTELGPRAPRKSEPEEEFFAIIPGVELHIRPDSIESTSTHPYRFGSKTTSYNCFYGKLSGGEFCLEDDDGELWVYYRRPLSVPPDNVPADDVFEGILRSIGFTHCVHPWPYYRQHRVDHRVVERWVKPPQQCETNGLAPMCEGRLRQATDSRNLFTMAAEFFAKRDEKAEVFGRALWLLHTSNPHGIAFEVRVLTLCSVLEGLVKEHAGGGLGSMPDPWIKAITALQLDWHGWFINVFQSWHNYRNKLAHGFDVLPSASNPIDILHVYSRIFAGIYVVMARQMDYTGKLEESMLENRNAILLTATSSSICEPPPQSN